MQGRDTGFRDVVDHVPLPLPERCGDDEHPLDEPTARRAVCAEAALRHRTAGRRAARVRRRCWWARRPARRRTSRAPGQRQDVPTGGRRLGVSTARPAPQPLLDPPAARAHRRLELRSREGPVAHPVPRGEHLLGLGEERPPDPMGRSSALGEGREFAPQVCPAQLPPRQRPGVVRAPAITDQPPAVLAGISCGRTRPAGPGPRHPGGREPGTPFQIEDWSGKSAGRG